MGRTNIKTPNRGSEYFIRPYARGKDDTYMDVSTQVTQAYVDTQVVQPHSIFSRPYLADAYPEMEYEYKPTIPVIPPFDPETVPGVTPVVPEIPEPVCYTPGNWTKDSGQGRPIAVGWKYSTGDLPTWAQIIAKSVGNNAIFGSLFLRPGAFERQNSRYLIWFDLSDYCGEITSVSITFPLMYCSTSSIELSVHKGTFDQGAGNFSRYSGFDNTTLYDIQTIIGTNSGNAQDMTWTLDSDGIEYVDSVLKIGSKVARFCITTYAYDIGVTPPAGDTFINSVTGKATMNFIIA